MSRSGYSDELDPLEFGRWRAQVRSATKGKRGQAFLRELALEMDAMPEKVLITGELIDAPSGLCCTIGVVCKARRLDVQTLDYSAPADVGDLVGIAKQLAAEIEYENDEGGYSETPAERWQRMREWVGKQLTPATPTPPRPHGHSERTEP